MTSLQGQVVLITGGARGIGFAPYPSGPGAAQRGDHPFHPHEPRALDEHRRAGRRLGDDACGERLDRREVRRPRADVPAVAAARRVRQIGELRAVRRVVHVHAVAQAIVVISGGIDLSVGSMMALASVTAATLMKDQSESYAIGVVIGASLSSCDTPVMVMNSAPSS